jgi:hypothetical protein
MLSKIVVKPIENLTGIGQLSNRNELITKVQYNINVFQEVHIYEIKEVHEEVEGQKVMEGNVAVLDKGVSLWGTEVLTLCLEDGRHMDFTVTRLIDKVNHRYEVMSHEDLYWK